MVLDPVEGFSVFRSSKTEPVVEENEEAKIAAQEKKEFNRQVEVCVLRFKLDT